MPRAARHRLTAADADPHALYELAVQQPQLMTEFIGHTFEQLTGRSPVTLREDFCGTAHLSSTWVRSGDDRRAVGVDIDRKMIAYAQRHSRAPLGDAAGRLKLTCADVLRCAARADVLASLNFSHCIYKTRKALMRYLRHARRCVKAGGLIVLDLYGGPGAMAPCCDKRRFGDFEYQWEQVSYDPVTAEVLNHIHFRFHDGSKMKRAFTYEWRLWTLPELREAMAEAGFGDVRVCFETPDGFDEDFDAAACEAWVAYLVARRG